MPLQRRPPSPRDSPSHNYTLPSLPTTPASSQPSSSSSSSVSTSETSLSTPFEQLAIHDHNIAHHPLFYSEHKPPADEAFYTLAAAAFSSQSQDLVDVEMFERMPQESDRMQSRRSTPGSPSLRTHALPHFSHSHFHSRSPVSPATERPSLTHRNTSFSKRHASFDSPREVPLPYMPPRAQNFSLASRTGPESDADSYSVYGHSTVDGRADGNVVSVSDSPMSPFLSVAGPQPNSPAPHYMDTSDDVGGSGGASTSTVTGSSSGRLPQATRSMSGPVSSYARPYTSGESSRPIHSPTPVRPVVLPDRSSTQSLPLPMPTPYHTLPTMEGGSLGAGGTGRDSESAPALPSALSPSLLPPLPASFPPAGPSHPSTFKVESLPSAEPRSTNSIASSSRAALPSRPPDWLRENSEPRRVPPTPTASVADTGIIPPAPPTVLTPPPSRSHAAAAHRPFLSQAPPPQDTYLSVETSSREYRLIARLPGFRRDAITLSTRRRRILHVVADSWEPNGGHFERRISFGYDADLTQVRAEFDGEHLCIIIPRQPMPMTWWGSRS